MADRTFPTPKTGPALTRKDFVSDQMVRWCPGCGDFAILAQVQKTLPKLGIPKEKIVFISGIGCSSRFPYYVDTYGFHSIHGRAPAIATGLKCARPDLQVWVVTGDGDGLSIGGNHLIHAIRRNIDINILLFNNRIYGLTKGQYSPTSERGKVTKSSPVGSLDRPIYPLRTALASEATFVARSVDADVQHLAETLERAATHKGTSFVEIYQNCIVFNNGAFEDIENRATRDDFVVKLEHGKPLIFGKDRDHGIRMKGGLTPEVVTFKPEEPPKDLLVHNEKAGAEFAYMLTQLEPPEFPTPVGVFRSVEEATYNDLLDAQIESAKKPGADDLSKLLAGPETWEVAA
ncbi:MAG: 2-oxoacid:ferredoxin oxidoreductase subunit beta [Elusimicrobia bacterium CG1_02_63_36]|nr:MAG: 2-oxoacid:ferredoxin oxidoreductase subunit beta [Elusimicrobia bacterium CG1_02_63_36]PIP83787.1 MAG: 2-oxoacid:ferredoxin oxidoreductase subunit beta [Elusimicrobia bacterium CG22_combo_CG10-13_8_21_14_all_63_91]PJA13196.1 MAG: 2-oxoacid:ferredoxin oxidoreductase subunit beta [Elusimicrobia bacterium CG_4_10_14_0_2_um_filter_63_34]PJB26445.1 MAG: 2-oxoacid:ferredoxin oxidoreductase subunit beta [Elusimicrobia bacterium CG_4_9_14_3_um_filter_62_55]